MWTKAVGVFQAISGLIMASCSPAVVVVDGGPMAAPDATRNGIFAVAIKTIEGRETTMAEWSGKAILVVNTASRCGYTPQFEGLQRLYQTYRDRGLVVLGFPCNQFLNQDPGSDKEIADFCLQNYGVTFQMMAKVEVKGDGIHPLFAHLTQSGESELRGEIGWNFEKFLIRPDGAVVARFRSRVAPEAAALVAAIEAALP